MEYCLNSCQHLYVNVQQTFACLVMKLHYKN
nr:MAG TPA: hypothetical protein [Caudoviricetes sp.]